MFHEVSLKPFISVAYVTASLSLELLTPWRTHSGARMATAQPCPACRACQTRQIALVRIGAKF